MGYDYLKKNEPTHQHLLVGRVENVFCKDDPRNLSEEITLYTVALTESQDVECPFTLPFVPALGASGAMSEHEEPYHVGEMVLVGFRQAHPEQPFILSRFFEAENTTNMQTTDEYPRHYKKRNGLVETVDKAGTQTIKLVKDQAINIEDSEGGLLFEVLESGKIRAHGEVELGGDLTGLVALMTEVAAGLIEGHIHLAGAPTGPALNGTTGMPLDLSGGVTTHTKAK